MFDTFFGAKRWRKAFYLLSPSSRGSIMPRVESRYVFPYIIENMKWKKKNLMKLNCAKYCILCMSSSDLWGHDLLRRFKGFCQKGMKGKQATKRRQFFPTMQTFVNMMEWSITSSSFRGLTTSSTFSTLKHTHLSISQNYIHRIRFTSKGTNFVGNCATEPWFSILCKCQ